MESSEFKNEVAQALAQKKTILFGCACTVVYSGRAESFLETGDRIVMIKNDHNLLVHQPTGTTPVNYMKTGSSHSVILDSDGLRVYSKNEKAKEEMIIDIAEIYFLSTQTLHDATSIALQGSERDMADMIMKHPELISPDFKPVSREEQTKYGFIDVFGYDTNGSLIVVECKRYAASLDAVQQLDRYVKKMKMSKGVNNIRGIVASPAITKNALRMLNDLGYEHRIVVPPKHHEEDRKKQAKLVEF